MKEVETNFTAIIKQIKPENLQKEKWKGKGFIKNHLGCVADDLVNAITNEWENIVVDSDEILKKSK